MVVSGDCSSTKHSIPQNFQPSPVLLFELRGRARMAALPARLSASLSFCTLSCRSVWVVTGCFVFFFRVSSRTWQLVALLLHGVSWLLDRCLMTASLVTPVASLARRLPQSPWHGPRPQCVESFQYFVSDTILGWETIFNMSRPFSFVFCHFCHFFCWWTRESINSRRRCIACFLHRNRSHAHETMALVRYYLLIFQVQLNVNVLILLTIAEI